VGGGGGGGGGGGRVGGRGSLAESGGGAWRAAPVLEQTFGTGVEPAWDCLVALEQQREQLEGILAQAKLRPPTPPASHEDTSSMSLQDVNREIERQRRDRETYSPGPARHLRPRGT
jgi:hypothetical protein